MPLRADPVERLQQLVQQQLLRATRGPGFCGVQLTEGGIESIEGLIRQFWIHRSGCMAEIRS
jgi:hypothetical protein